jgi:hypothetical protein
MGVRTHEELGARADLKQEQMMISPVATPFSFFVGAHRRTPLNNATAKVLILKTSNLK